uniref:SRCR domain-containing protein n=1 Tax=Astyanax mexicanus TaxID=7994 RepID=A0A8B9H408_ASTMX
TGKVSAAAARWNLFGGHGQSQRHVQGTGQSRTMQDYIQHLELCKCGNWIKKLACDKPLYSSSFVIGGVNIKLINGTGSCSGRVEVYYNGEWGTVCDDDWDINDAAVVCRQMRCGEALSVHSKAHLGAGTCSGSENSITGCHSSSHNCGHHEDAGVTCADNIRLVNGGGRCRGRVEIYHNGQWGTVCDDDWGMDDAEVVCSQMGCGKATSIHKKAHFGQGSGPILLDDVGCSGTEITLTSCSHRGLGINDCNHGEDAGVVCSGKTVVLTKPLQRKCI